MNISLAVSRDMLFFFFLYYPQIYIKKKKNQVFDIHCKLEQSELWKLAAFFAVCGIIGC